MICSLPSEVLEKAICKAFELGARQKSIQLGEEPKFISQRREEVQGFDKTERTCKAERGGAGKGGIQHQCDHRFVSIGERGTV